MTDRSQTTVPTYSVRFTSIEPGVATPQNVVEFCAKELEWMMRGAAAHECLVLQRAVDRLRGERDKIILRAGGIPA